MKIKDIYDFLDSIAPFKTSLDWDNSGFLVGNINDEFKSGLVCLDITDNIVDECVKKHCNLIISHHPVIFNRLHRVTSDMTVYKLIKNDINVICLHTNLDLSKIGVNFVLALALNLSNLSFNNNLESIGLIGQLDNQLTPIDFIRLVKNKLSCNKLSFVPGNKQIKTVAVCGGSGANFLFELIDKNIDAYVTSEIKYNIWLEAKKANITLVDAGHFNTENLVCSHLVNILNKYLNSNRFEVAENNINIIESI